MPGKRRGTPAKREAAAQRQRAELEELQGRLADQVEQLTDSGAWRAWLDVAARFHTYSVNNSVLILLQKPHATLVAGYTDWQKMGRQVQKGEGGSNAIRILAPVKRRVPVNKDDDATPAGADGTERTEQDGTVTRVRTVGFKPTSVFDVSQTEGDPLPERPRPELLDGRAPEGLWQALEQFGTERGWDIGTEHITDGGNGYTDFTAGSIRVHDAVEPAQAVKTLAHELGHALLHSEGTHRGVAEVEAESVAHLVLAAHGADTDKYTFDYVTGWASQVPGQQPADTVRATADRVLGASRTILNSTLDDPLDGDTAREQRAHAQRSAEETSALADRAELRAGTASASRDRSSRMGRADTATRVSHEPELVTAPDKQARLATANAAAAAFYRRQLNESSNAYGYVTSRVGALDQLPAGVRIGYAPSGWTTLLDHMRSSGWDDRDLLDAGLVQHTRHGTLVDRFRDRVVVAMHDDDGNVAGFIGRPPHEDFDAERTPKYLNTAGGDLFDKGKVLFGVHEQRDALAAGATPVLVEGPFDALSLAASDGAAHRIAPVATSGTAVTPHQLVALHQAAGSDRLVLSLDGDQAGQDAGVRAADLALDLPREVATVTLPDGHDPASWVARHDDPAAALQPYLDPQRQTPAAHTLIDDRIEQYFADHPPQHRSEVEGQVQALHATAPVLARLDTDGATRAGVHIAERLQLDPGTVAAAVAEAQTADGEATKRVHDRAAVAHDATLTASPGWHRRDSPVTRGGDRVGTYDAASSPSTIHASAGSPGPRHSR